MKRVRVQRNILALAIATALNGLVILILLIDHESKFREFSTDTVQVYLVPKFPRVPREKPQVRQPPKAPSEVAVPAPEPMAPVPRLSGPSTDTANSEPFDPATLRSVLRSRSGCLSATHLTAEEQEKCAEFLGSSGDKAAMPLGLGGGKQNGFEQQIVRNAAISAYKRSNSARDYPSLRSVFGGKAPKPPEDVGPGEPLNPRR
jgi:hypothetical protein